MNDPYGILFRGIADRQTEIYLYQWYLSNFIMKLSFYSKVHGHHLLWH